LAKYTSDSRTSTLHNYTFDSRISNPNANPNTNPNPNPNPDPNSNRTKPEIRLSDM